MKQMDIKLILDKNKHFYSGILPKVVCPSSTTIDQSVAKPALVPWAVKVTTQKALVDLIDCYESGHMSRDNIEQILINSKSEHRTIFKEAGEVGSLTHQHINRFLSGHPEVEIENPKVAKQYASFKRFLYENKINVLTDVIYSEKKVGSKVFRYGGSLDVKWKVNGEIHITDFKGSSGIWESYWRQLASYWTADRETNGDDKDYLSTDKISVLRLIDGDSYEFKTIDLVEAKYHFNRFVCLVNYWWAENDWKLMNKVKKEVTDGKQICDSY